MKNIVFKNRWVQIVFGSLLLVAGVLTLTFAIVNNQNLTSAISIIVAVCSFILGIIYIVSSFVSETTALFPGSLFFGSICIAIGVLLCVNTQVLGQIIVYLVGALMLAYGLVSAIKSTIYVIMRKKGDEGKVKIFYIVLFYVLAAALITLGILTYVYNNNASIVIYACVGVAIAIYGIYHIIDGAKVMHKNEKEKKQQLEKVVSTQTGSKEIETKTVIEENEIIDKTK